MDKKIFVTQSSMPTYEEYIEIIKPLWDTRWLTNMGVYHDQLTENLKEYLKVPNISLVSNGHMALELAIQAMDLPKGSEVITTPFTFISTTHAIVRNGLQPVFCDINDKDFTIDVTKIEGLITENTSAIVPVHVYGNLCDVDAIQKIANKYNLKVIYDAAHCFGVEKNGIGVGNYGNASCFSFHATKVFNTIEGGAVTFTDQTIGEKLYNLKNFGIRSEEMVVSVGANAKLNEFQAAMGLCNLKHIEEEIAKRKNIVAYYRENLKNVNGISLVSSDSELKSNYAYFPILVNNGKRNLLYDTLRNNGIFSRKYFFPLTADQFCFNNRYCNSKIYTARNVSDRVLVLPLYADLQFDDVNRICNLIEEII